MTTEQAAQSLRDAYRKHMDKEPVSDPRMVSDTRLKALQSDIDKGKAAIDELATIRATLLINFGGLKENMVLPTLIRDEGSTQAMMLLVLQHLVKIKNSDKILSAARVRDIQRTPDTDLARDQYDPPDMQLIINRSDLDALCESHEALR